MILASKSGLLCACKVVGETNKAWLVQYAGEKGKETRVLKSSGRKMFDNVDDALEWIGEEDEQ
jgi:hypothetical protein